ncbi:HlyC/CorC family transporter [soil metagenome]
MNSAVVPAIVVLLLAVYAFCSATQAAFTAFSHARISELEKRGVARAGRVLRIAEERERLTGTLILAERIAATGATTLAAAALIPRFGWAGAAYTAGGAIVAILILGEIAPRALALIYPDRFALAVAPVAGAMMTILGPFVTAAEGLVTHILALFRLNTAAARNILSAHDELRGAIALSHREGAVVKKDRDMLGGVLDLKELELADVMIHRTKMTIVDVDSPPSEIISETLKSGHSRIPVYRENPDNIIGVLHAKDILSALHAQGGDAGKIDIGSTLKPPWFVPQIRRASDQLNAFLRQKTHFALVVDEYGEVMGLVTLEDILEEIVGEISDEHDPISARIRRQKDGSVVVDGAAPIRDVNRAMEWDLPDTEATTLAGLVIHEARTIPDAGQTFTFHGFRFEVLRKRRHQVTAVRVTKVE